MHGRKATISMPSQDNPSAATECEMNFEPRAVAISPFGTARRNKSAADLRESFKTERFVRIHSDDNVASKVVHHSSTAPSEISSLSTSASTERRRLSETRGINLPKIEMPQKPTKPSPLTGALVNAQNPSPLSELLLTGERSAERVRDVVSMRIYVPHLLEEHPHGDEDNGNGGILFDIEGGREATAEFLLQLMAREYGIEHPIASEAFALWMVSPLLEVQLKPHHRPYEVRKRWMTLLQRFAHGVEEDAMEVDEPAMFFRRNVNLEREREIALVACCTNSLDMLFLDARTNLFSGRLFLDNGEAARLAGIGFAIDVETYDERKHNVEFIRKNIDSQLPDFLASRVCGSIVFGKALSGTREFEELILNTWREASAAKMRCGGGEVNELKREYLEVLRETPSYGSAFFHASIERPNISPLKEIKTFFRNITHSSPEIQILFGVNRNSVTLLDCTKHEYLLSHQIVNCKWRPIRDKSVEESANSDPTELLLNLACVDEHGHVTNNLLKIFSNQSPLIEALLSSMQEMIAEQIEERERLEKLYDVSPVVSSATTEPMFISRPSNSVSNSEPNSANSSGSSRRSSHSAGSHCSFIKESRLCLAKFENGICTKARGSLRKMEGQNFGIKANA